MAFEEIQNVFSNLQNLKLHIKGTHEGKKEFVCDTCDKAFTQKNNLLTHLARIHENISFRCNICDEYFASKSKASYHKENVHMGTKNSSKVRYSCEICSKSFVRKSTLETHLAGVHKTT